MTKARTPVAAKGWTLLLVDDDADIRATLATFLAGEIGEVSIQTAAYPADAMRKMESWPIDVLLTDQRMPGMTGTQLIAWAQEEHPATQCLLMSSTPDKELGEAVARLGIAFFAKPLSTETLGQLVRTLRSG